MTALTLAEAVLEGIDPKAILRGLHRTPGAVAEDEFLLAYYEAMLWSTTMPPFGECPQCGGQGRLLCRWDDDQEPVCCDCSEREPNHEPPGDENYCIDDISGELKRDSMRDCALFCRDNQADLRLLGGYNGYSAMACAGHNFWLTREGHGVGFRDRGNADQEVLERLHVAASRFGGVDVYVGDDGKIYA